MLRRGYEFKYTLTVLFSYTHWVGTSKDYGFKQFEEKISGQIRICMKIKIIHYVLYSMSCVDFDNDMKIFSKIKNMILFIPIT